jgi:hypothetical protein
MMDWVVYVVQLKPGRNLSNAEAHRLIREAVHIRRTKSLRYRVLAGLGRRLSAWGERLQSPYDAALS